MAPVPLEAVPLMPLPDELPPPLPTPLCVNDPMDTYDNARVDDDSIQYEKQ